MARTGRDRGRRRHVQGQMGAEAFVCAMTGAAGSSASRIDVRRAQLPSHGANGNGASGAAERRFEGGMLRVVGKGAVGGGARGPLSLFDRNTWNNDPGLA